MTKVTVLVAVYNASQYLPACLNSLKEQEMKDIQVVCIDDASTDGSLQILQSFAAADRRFEVVSLSQNQGQAHARNSGLQQARGEYICFLDADDWFEPDSLAKAVSEFEEHKDADAVLFDVSKDFADHSELYEMPPFESLSGYEAFRLSLSWKIHGVYMVRAAIHQRFPYDETCKAYSDDNSTRLHFLASRCVRRCAGVYHYRQHAASVTHSVGVRRYDYLRANESMKRQLSALKAAQDIIAEYENHRWFNLVDVYMFHFVHGSELSPADRQYGLSELRRVWHNIDRSLLLPRNIRKLGYRPMAFWWLFRLEEWFYFSLRGLLGKNY